MAPRASRCGKHYSGSKRSARRKGGVSSTTSKFLGERVKEAVITVPAYFNDSCNAMPFAELLADRRGLECHHQRAYVSTGHMALIKRGYETVLISTSALATFDVSFSTSAFAWSKFAPPPVIPIWVATTSTAGLQTILADEFHRENIDLGSARPWRRRAAGRGGREGEGVETAVGRRRRGQPAICHHDFNGPAPHHDHQSIPVRRTHARSGGALLGPSSRVRRRQGDRQRHRRGPSWSAGRPASLVQALVRWAHRRQGPGQGPSTWTRWSRSAPRSRRRSRARSPTPAGSTSPLSPVRETAGGVMTKIIERNTTIPAWRSEVFSYRGDNQPAVDIVVLQGEREKCATPRARWQVQAGEHPSGPQRSYRSRSLRHRCQRIPATGQARQGHRRRAGHHHQRTVELDQSESSQMPPRRRGAPPGGAEHKGKRRQRPN